MKKVIAISSILFFTFTLQAQTVTDDYINWLGKTNNLYALNDTALSKLGYMWRLHKVITEDGTEAYASNNEFLNLIGNGVYERKVDAVQKGTWSVFFSKETDDLEGTSSIEGYLMLQSENRCSSNFLGDDCDCMRIFTLAFHKINNVTYLEMTDLRTLKTYFYLKQM